MTFDIHATLHLIGSGSGLEIGILWHFLERKKTDYVIVSEKPLTLCMWQWNSFRAIFNVESRKLIEC